MEWTTILLGLVGLCGLYLIGIFIVKPLKFIFKLVMYLVIGALLLIFFNLISSHFGIHIPLNPFTLITAGVLQVPGVILLLLMEYMLF
ncbi:inhibitor of the pro-sigma K processing machinery [Desulfohalotomaculum tongense]|uniref:pro-sigmaK processing inhibitor BofA family protein n=1 Tax=Desulforadius tongensis TaxID=1216062 RepID=UPI00195C82A1|nr:pro-sigmaK processing inhibitor BofA family protein [Desulforadius tongensis]MBM7855161.1 inhibitor of the pro-sigma K processing machinery [Desulforadius tongensis]